MEKRLTFSIEERPLPELWDEWDICRCLMNRIKLSGEDPHWIFNRIDVIWNEIVRLNIAIIFQHYKAGSIDAFLQDSRPERGVKGMFADEIEELQMSSRICGILARLDVPKIEASGELKDLYHRMRLKVDETRDDGRFFFYDPFFWDMYFRFWYAYNESE